MASAAVPPDVLAACRDHLSACRRFCVDQPELAFERTGLTVATSGVDFANLNGVLATSLDGAEDIGEAIREVTDHFARLALPMVWWRRPTDGPPDLDRHLLAAGYELKATQPVMVRRGDQRAEPPTVEGLSIEAVTATDFDAYREVLTTAFALPAQAAASFGDAIERAGFDPTGPVRSFIGRLGGRPVATSTVMVGDGTGGIYNIAVLEEARRRGTGAALTAAAMNSALDDGLELLSLQSSAAGYRVYEALGFAEICRFESYSPNPA